MRIDVGKAKEAAAQVAEKVSDKAVEIGAVVADQTKKGFQAAQGAAADANRTMQLRKYNPLFPTLFESSDYSLPEMLVIADGEERKDIEVCAGAIGWTSKEAQLNVVHIYSKFVSSSGISFFPAPKVDCVYLVDASNPSRYIDLSSYFSTIESEKIAELIEVGRCLGAKKCTVETYEVEKRVSLKRGSADVKGNGQGGLLKEAAEVQVDVFSKQSQSKEYKTLSIQEFAGSEVPQRPVLRWFKDDAAICNLVESFCGENAGNLPKKVHREVARSSASTMSGTMAGKVEAALKKMGAQFNFSIEGEAKRESRQTWALDIEF